MMVFIGHLEALGKRRLPKKYNLSICCIFKNEADHLKEWIEYHRLVGVNHFYLYNNGSTDTSTRVLLPYMREGVVTLIDWPDCFDELDEDEMFIWSLNRQVAAFEHSVKFKAAGQTKWLVCLEVNEFLVPVEASTLNEILDEHDDHPGITLKCDHFDAFHFDPLRKLVIESSEMVSPPEVNIFRTVSKTIFKPDACKGFIWPPYKCVFKNRKTDITVKKSELRVNSYSNRFTGFLKFGNEKERLDVDNRLLSEEETAEYLEMGYEIEDQEKCIQRFIPDLKDKMRR
jgi:hypothetical protein